MEKDKVNTGRRKTILSEEDKIQIAKEYKNEGMNVLKLSSKWHVDQRRISQILRDKGVLKKRGGQTYYDQDEIINHYKSGISATEIARMVGCTKTTVYEHIRKYKEQLCNAAKEEPKEKEVKKRTISISIGDKLEYIKIANQNGQGRVERRKKIMQVIDIINDLIVCRHKEGTIETFTKFDCKVLFGTGRMRKIEVK